MEGIKVFKLVGPAALTVEHEIDANGGLSIWFRGEFIGRYGDVFEEYVEHLATLERMAADTAVVQIYCHLESLGETVSRAQHVIYRTLQAIRLQGKPVTVYAGDSLPENAEHLRMARLFVDGVSRQPGASIELVKVSG